MERPFPEYKESLKKNIRKCRKKLRQIETLEVLKRALTPDEQAKVIRKDDLRSELQYLISEYEGNSSLTNRSDEQIETNADDMKRSHSQSSENEELTGSDLIQFSEKNSPKKVSRVDDINSSSQPEVNSSVVVPNPVSENSVTVSEVDSANKDTASASANSSNVASSSKTENSASNEKAVQSKIKQLRKIQFCVDQLDGHNDLVMDVACDEKYFISSSRDTTVKIWNLNDEIEVNSLRGHTGAVTCVSLMTVEESQGYLSGLPIPPVEKKHRVVITASTDCSVRIWSLDSGKEIKSIYTYNGVSSLVYISNLKCLLTGTDGGKLELWDACTGYNYDSLHSADEEIKCLQLSGERIFSGTDDCILKVHEIRDNKISTLFDTELEFINTPHVLMDLSVHGDDICCGDDHPNLKIVSWRSGRAQVRKLKNVRSGFGTSDAVKVIDKFLLSSSYDLDTGESSINVRTLPSLDYLYTLRCTEFEVGRILKISAVNLNNKKLKIITAGQNLCIWELYLLDHEAETSDDRLYQTVGYFKDLTKAAVNSDVESESELAGSDDEDSSETDDEEQKLDNIEYEATSRPWFDSWCAIL